MRKILIFVVLMAVLGFVRPSEPGTMGYTYQEMIKSIWKSDADYRADLRNKQYDLAEYERVIAEITADLERAAANAPICAVTGQKRELNITYDPRDELREKCDALREEIRRLEKRLES